MPKLFRQNSSLSIVLITFICLMLFPFQTKTVPRWKIRVEDEEGKPYINQYVFQSWKNYSLELTEQENEEEIWTDANGYVDFPEHTIHAGLLQRIFMPLWAELRTLGHGSTGIKAYVLVWGADTYPHEAVYTPGQPLPERIVVPR